MTKVSSKIIGDTKYFTVQHRIFNAVLFAGILQTLFAGISNFFINTKPITYIFPFISFIVFVFIHYFSINKKNLRLTSQLSFIYLLFVFFPVEWFLNGGSQGSFQSFTMFFLVALLITMPTKKTIFILLFFITIIGVLLVEFLYPELVIEYHSTSERYIDIAITYSILFFAFLSVINIFIKIYEKANKDLEEMNKTKDKFFSIIAHDLKSPFNSMLGFSEILKNNFDDYDVDMQKNSVEYIHQGINQSYKLLENLLLWAQSQRGTIEFNPKKVNLFTLISETNQLLEQVSDVKSIKLINEIHETIFVNADRDLLSIIIRNLISNAIKFTPKGGEISIKSQTINDSNKFVEIIVKDMGVGISKEKQSKLFDIRESTSTKGTENEKGTGLGLILCKEFVEIHGGTIWVKSEIGKGSSFSFTIPYYSENVNDDN